MAKRIIWVPVAAADRIEIIEYWYRRIGTKTYSKKLDKSFKEAIRLILRFPKLGRQVEGRAERVLVKDNYQIFYLIKEDVIEIRRIWDSRRDPDELDL